MTHQMTRRSFLGAASGVWIAPATGAWARRSANAQLNVAMIGTGGMGGGNTNGVAQAGGTIFALCDVDEQTLGKASKRHPKAKTFTDFRTMLEKEKNIDAAVVSTPDHQHAVASVMAMKMGKHCYCEKPLTHDIHEARVMKELAREKKLATQMGNRAHSTDGIRRTVEIIRAGLIGAVKEVHCWSNRPIWPQAIPRPKRIMEVPKHLHWDLWLGTAPDRPYHSAYHPFKWRGWWDFGTGALGDMACHIMDYPVWALDLGHATSVEGVCDVRMPESGPRWSIVTYEFPARGDKPPVTLKWWDGSKEGVLHQPPKELGHGQPYDKTGALFIGAKGTLYVGLGKDPVLLPLDRFKDTEKPKPAIARSIGHYAEWVKACQGEGTTASNFDYAGPLSEVVLLGVMACRVEGRIEWDGEAMKAKNSPAAQAVVKREYRKGWSL